VPTSVALDPRFVADLKKEAKARGIPYQVLMRMFIIEGFERMKKKSA
jgi:predicted DNA binding CopG/RHH family protein